MANSKSASKQRKIIDVTAPGKSAPSASARPIIVTNRPVLKQDPMMIGESLEEDDSNKVSRVAQPLKAISPDFTKEDTSPVPAGAPAVTKATLSTAEGGKATTTEKPPEIPDTKKDKEQSPVEIKKDTSGKTDEPEAPKVAEPESTEDSEEPQPDNEEAEETETDGQVAPNRILDEAKKKEEDQKTAKMIEQEKVIGSKKYFLPINAVKRRQGVRRIIVTLILVILLALLWLDLVLDAGIIKLGNLHSLTHFFSS